MADELVWKVRENETFHKPEALYATSGGRVAVVIPLHDPLDGDWNGKVSWGEWTIAKVTGVGSLLGTSQMARLLKSIAVDECDEELDMAAEKTFKEAFVEGVEWGVKKAYVEVWAGAMGKYATAGMAATPIRQFFVRKALEAVVKKSYDAAVATTH